MRKWLRGFSDFLLAITIKEKYRLENIRDTREWTPVEKWQYAWALFLFAAMVVAMMGVVVWLARLALDFVHKHLLAVWLVVMSLCLALYVASWLVGRKT